MPAERGREVAVVKPHSSIKAVMAAPAGNFSMESPRY